LLSYRFTNAGTSACVIHKIVAADYSKFEALAVVDHTAIYWSKIMILL